jgi:glycerophosphoryl diester phosphodiesterase
MIFDTKPTVIGHRDSAPVNPAVAGKHHRFVPRRRIAGLSWIELDVQRSRDDQLVIRRRSGYTGRFLVTRTAEQLASSESCGSRM